VFDKMKIGSGSVDDERISAVGECEKNLCEGATGRGECVWGQRAWVIQGPCWCVQRRREAPRPSIGVLRMWGRSERAACGQLSVLRRIGGEIGDVLAMYGAFPI
jgi:hypothetical protein